MLKVFGINYKEIKFMKIDILSDLHLDFYFKPHLTTEENVVSFFEPHSTPILINFQPFLISFYNPKETIEQ